MTSEALDCHYSTTGSGPAIFFIHGIGAAEDAWRFITPKLSENFSVITYDLRGHGKSPVTNKNFSLEDLVLDLERIRENLNIEKVKEDLDWYFEYIHLLSNKDEKMMEYLDCVLAMKIQKPDVLMRIILIFIGLQGTGKSLFSFLLQQLLIVAVKKSTFACFIDDG